MAIFVRLVKAAVQRKLGGPSQKPYQDAIRRRVFEAMNWLELMRVFGGRAQLLDAPTHEVHRALLVLMGQGEADRDSADEMDAEAKRIQNAANQANMRRY